MCLCVIDYRPGHDWPLLLTANRDEFLDRPTEAMHWWQTTEHSTAPVLAGRDLKAGGTWLAVDPAGRMALLTNIRPGHLGRTGQRSRGELPLTFLQAPHSIRAFHQSLLPDIDHYAGFNLVLFDQSGLFWFSSDHPQGQWLESGIHGLSNDAINTPWPKVELARKQMTEHHDKLGVMPWQPSDLASLPILSDSTPQPDDQLPDTGVPKEWERTLSAQTITSERYGSRCRTWIAVHSSGHIQVSEAQLKPNGTMDEPRVFSWQIQQP
ncbi:NRDE family protein [Saccharospirillum impatiens]|uniref:NRDE family protein n=1 Tax=Saccharospirillum impatiens TaxID=169438 RepID=UPI00041D8400|nr:NRDE family protein [Saccharospirillum impatiens]